MSKPNEEQTSAAEAMALIYGDNTANWPSTDSEDPQGTTERALTIREETGLSWSASCALAELERDGGTIPARLAEGVRAHNCQQDRLGTCYVPPVQVRWPA